VVGYVGMWDLWWGSCGGAFEFFIVVPYDVEYGVMCVGICVVDV
jgi:hypothetical protein